jgi:SAM-dependent methyltransferase
MNLLGTVHSRLVQGRRVVVLARRLAHLIPAQSSVIDIGCGDGKLASHLLALRPDLAIRGVDVLVRPDSTIPVEAFNGQSLPLGTKSVDVALLIDVLHHTSNPAILLQEAARVARKAILLKDHTRDRCLAQLILHGMDWVGNARYGVRLPYNYWSTEQWLTTCGTLGLRVEHWETRLGLYPWPASMLFERSLHMIALLTPHQQNADAQYTTAIPQ